MSSHRTPRWVPVVCSLWAVLVLTTMVLLWRYKSAPGKDAELAPKTWPVESRVARTPGRSTILLFAHPKCSCTRASIEELGTLMTRVSGVADAHVLFLKPPASPEDWERSDTRKRAAELPGVDVATDSDGAEAERFGARTSGETLVYDADGRLLFHGGITSARGHAGDNAGRRRITELLSQPRTTESGTSPTFGCGLAERETR